MKARKAAKAMKGASGNNVFVADVARFLAVESADVKRMVEMDGLPAISIPQAQRPVLRIPLRGLHEWLQKRAKNDPPGLRSYESFEQEFMTARTGNF